MLWNSCNIQGEVLFQVSDINTTFINTLCGTAPSCGEKTDVWRVKSNHFTRGHSRSDKNVWGFTGLNPGLKCNFLSTSVQYHYLSFLFFILAYIFLPENIKLRQLVKLEAAISSNLSSLGFRPSVCPQTWKDKIQSQRKLCIFTKLWSSFIHYFKETGTCVKGTCVFN